MKTDYNVIGAGLAGSEAALVLARAGKNVRLFEQKPKRFSAVHKLKTPAELVCSNSFKSTEITSAHGLLKKELSYFDSPLMEMAYQSRVPGGKALSIDREKFSELVNSQIKAHPRIDFVCDEVTEIPEDVPTLIATGPLSSESIISALKSKYLDDENLYFYDATSPIIHLDSLNIDRFFWANRNQEGDDYLNLALNKEEYLKFRENLLSAEKAESHSPDEELKFFEGCLPVEVLAERGQDTLAYSCMRPIGLFDPALVQNDPTQLFRCEEKKRQANS